MASLGDEPLVGEQEERKPCAEGCLGVYMICICMVVCYIIYLRFRHLRLVLVRWNNRRTKYFKCLMNAKN